jgi:DNA-binding transcriptional regulator YiaG
MNAKPRQSELPLAQRKQRSNALKENGVALDALDNAMRKLNMSEARLAEELGYSSGAVREWRTYYGKMPKAAALACECLVRRQGNTLHEKVLVIRTNDADAITTLKTIAEKIGVSVKEI